MAKGEGALSEFPGRYRISQGDFECYTKRINSQHLQHIILELQEVTVLNTKSGHTDESIKQGLTDNYLALSTLMDQQHHVLSDRIDALGKLLLTQHLRDPEIPKSDQLPSLSERGANTQTVRVVTSRRLPCRSWCPCACHTKRKLKLTAPGIMEGVLGRIFVGYSSLPLLRERCDFRECRDRRHASATVEYWFPSWFISMHLKSYLTYLPRTGPEFLLSTIRRVADDSQSITFAMEGNIEVPNNCSLKNWPDREMSAIPEGIL
jgi:hypothetical protein